MDDRVIGVEGFVSLGESFELPDEIANGRLFVLLWSPLDEPSKRLAFAQPPMADDFVVFVVRDQHPLLLGGVLEVDFVSRALGEDIFLRTRFPSRRGEEL